MEDPPRVSSPLITGLFRFAFNLIGRSQQKIFPMRHLKPSLFFISFSVAVNDIHVTKGALFLIAGRLCKDGVSGGKGATDLYVFLYSACGPLPRVSNKRGLTKKVASSSVIIIIIVFAS